MIPDDAWPAGDRLTWGDDGDRLTWDFTTDPYESRPYTDEENAAADARETVEAEEAHRSTLMAAAVEALAENRAFLDLDVVNAARATAQVKALTRQMNVALRLAMNDLSAGE